ncbi:MAG: hypothetical protein H7X80_04400, partial [bacterium]|nr:hypothetical protein [Candidatus Kapabacteria bacterium]
SYATVDAAITAISLAPSITGPVNMLIRAGTYTPPTTGWILPAKIGMTTTNRITFRPYPGENVVLQGAINTSTAVFNITGSFYTIDGSNTVGGTSKNMRITQTNTIGGFAVRIYDNSDEVQVRNLNMQSNSNSNSGSSGGVITLLGGPSGSADNGIIEGNTIGDSSNTYRAWIQIYMYSPYTTRITNTIIRNNVIVNGSNSIGQGYYSYMIRIDPNVQGTRLEGNYIHQTTGAVNLYQYAIYVQNSSGQSPNTVISGNRIRMPFSTGTTYEYTWGVYIYDYNASFSTTTIANNFIFSTSATTYTYGQGYIGIQGGYNTSSAVNVYNNSIYSAGSTYEQAFFLYYQHSGSTPLAVNFRNNIAYSTRTQGYLSIYYTFDYSGTGMGLTTSDNMIQHTMTAYYWAYPGTQYSSLAAWQGSGQDVRTTAATPNFVNAAAYDLHIDSTKVQQMEGRGFQTSLATDIDGNARAVAPYLPDIGADEGNFIGTGLKITQPTANLQVTSNYQMTVAFNNTRPMNTRIELSTNNGATWSLVGSVAPTAPPSNTVVIPTPNVETSTARIRVVSNLNPLEADTSGVFSLVRPVFTMIAANGGESLVPTDTTTLRWSSQFVPPTMPVTLEYQLGDNMPWIPIIASITSQNLPSINSTNWIIPNTPSSTVRMRVKPVGVTTLGDSSNAVFTIAPMPVLRLLAPMTSPTWFVGETRRIEWTSTTVAQVRVEYSTDGGTNWKIATTGTTFVPASAGGYDWMIPDEATKNALVRVTSIERPRFNSIGRIFEIVKGSITLDSPNGGEQFELGERITVSFMAPTSTNLDLMYSSDGGSSWHNINPVPGVPIAASVFGTVDVTLPSLPTRRALLRIVDVDRTWLYDQSDNVFEIMEAPGLMVYTPAQGDEIVRGTQTTITWFANRIGRVNIDYSSTGGLPTSSYVRIASNIDAVVANQSWSVPNTSTPNGRIRFTSAVDGTTIAESGIFSIVDAAVTALRVDGPNGGEVYDAGDKIVVRWSGTNVPTVSVRYSSDAGISWNPIAVNIPAMLRQVEWTAPNVGSARYRVAVESINPSISDLSDADFEIRPSVLPSLGLLNPVGGETLYAGDTIPINWAMNGLAGAVVLTYTVDDGATWKPLVTLPHDALNFYWIVPNEPTLVKGNEAGLMSAPTARVAVAQGNLADTSGGFSIAVRQAPAVAVTAPNGAEIWREGQQVTIGWNFQVLTNVDIMLSTDDGATWGTTIATNIPAAPLNYTYTVPHLNDNRLNNVKVMVRANPGGAPSDISDAPFTFLPLGTVGIGEITSVHELSLFGAFPNPFATSTEVRWKQNVNAPVTLRVYNLVGAIVAQQSTDMLAPGTHQLMLTSG